MGVADGAVAAAQQAGKGGNIAGVEQLASVYANAGKLAELDATVETLRRVAPDRAATAYFAAVSAFLHGQFADAVKLADRAVAADPAYAAVYDLAGAADTKLGDLKRARAAFETSLHFNAHDSSAYANLGLLELSAGNRAEAARDFSEALWLDPQSAPAREGLTQARQQVAR
jgi:tetratricopeptide (TPR) repeat protein